MGYPQIIYFNGISLINHLFWVPPHFQEPSTWYRTLLVDRLVGYTEAHPTIFVASLFCCKHPSQIKQRDVVVCTPPKENNTYLNIDRCRILFDTVLERFSYDIFVACCSSPHMLVSITFCGTLCRPCWLVG